LTSRSASFTRASTEIAVVDEGARLHEPARLRATINHLRAESKGAYVPRVIVPGNVCPTLSTAVGDFYNRRAEVRAGVVRFSLRDLVMGFGDYNDVIASPLVRARILFDVIMDGCVNNEPAHPAIK
jgi:hypothetical protein